MATFIVSHVIYNADYELFPELKAYSNRRDADDYAYRLIKNSLQKKYQFIMKQCNFSDENDATYDFEKKLKSLIQQFHRDDQLSFHFLDQSCTDPDCTLYLNITQYK